MVLLLVGDLIWERRSRRRGSCELVRDSNAEPYALADDAYAFTRVVFGCGVVRENDG